MISQKEVKLFYKRKLPHFQPNGGTFFITYTLKGAIPKQKFIHLSESYRLAKAELKEDQINEQDRARLFNELSEKEFDKFEKLLNGNSTGPHHLKNPIFANIIIDSLLYCEKRNDFKMITYCIMSNHVHLIINQVTRQLSDIMRDHKRFTARRINKLLNQEGSFWERETFDHYIRNEVKLGQKIRYVLENPVIPGIVKHWEIFPFSWINPAFVKYAPE